MTRTTPQFPPRSTPQFTFVRALLTASLLSATTLVAQTTGRSTVGLNIGAAINPAVGVQNQPSITFNPAFTLGAEYDYRLFTRKVAIDAGIDFLVSPNDIKVSNPAANVSPQYAYLFLTPHVRATLFPEGKLSPWLLFGGGYADFAPAPPRVPLVEVRGAGSNGTFVFGGGVDTKPFYTFKHLPLLGSLPIGSRFEVRDFYSGQPNYGVRTTGSYQNTIVFTGGLLLHF